MTVETTTNRIRYIALAGATAFDFAFAYFVETDIQVFIDSNTPLSSGFSVTASPEGESSGGTVTLDTALTGGESVLIRRQIPNTQTTDYVENSGFPSDVTENDFDRAAIRDQDQQEIIARSIQFTPETTVTDVFADGPTSSDTGKALILTEDSGTFSFTYSTERIEDIVTAVEADATRAETARTGVEAAQVSAEAARDVALAQQPLVVAEGDAQVARIQLAGDLDDRIAVARDTITKALAGTIGEEGAYDVTGMASGTISSTPTTTDFGVTSTRVTFSADLGLGTVGLASSIDVETKGNLLVTGGPYEVVYVSGADAYLHPKHGTVTPTGTAVVQVQVEDTANQASGAQTRTEYFLGSERDTIAEIETVIGGSAPQDGAINVGYFDDGSWNSMLLDDAIFNAAAFGFRLERKLIAITSVSVLNSAGAWVDYTEATAGTQYTYDVLINDNEILVNKENSFSPLGYTSEAEMRNNSAVRIIYTHAPRAARPASRIESLADFPMAFYSNSAGGAANLVYLGTQEIPTDSQVFIDEAVVTSRRQGSVNNAIDNILHSRVNPKSVGGNGMVWTYSLVDLGTNYGVQIHFKEVVSETSGLDELQPSMSYNFADGEWLTVSSSFTGTNVDDFLLRSYDSVTGTAGGANTFSGTVVSNEGYFIGKAMPAPLNVVTAVYSLRGHLNSLPIENDITTVTDDDSNVILVGTLTIDTGVPSP